MVVGSSLLLPLPTYFKPSKYDSLKTANPICQCLINGVDQSIPTTVIMDQEGRSLEVFQVLINQVLRAVSSPVKEEVDFGRRAAVVSVGKVFMEGVLSCVTIQSIPDSVSHLFPLIKLIIIGIFDTEHSFLRQFTQWLDPQSFRDGSRDFAMQNGTRSC